MAARVGWLWKAMAGNAVWALLVLLVGLGMGYLRLTGSDLLGPAMYALGAMALASVTYMGFKAISWLHVVRRTVNPAVAEARIVEWSSAAGYGIKVQKTPEALFHRAVTLTNGVPVDVMRTRERPNYMHLQSRVTLDGDLADLQGKKLEYVKRHLHLELSRARVEFLIENPLKSFGVAVALPIDLGLTSDKFMEATLRIDSAVRSGVMAIQIAVDEFDSRSQGRRTRRG